MEACDKSPTAFPSGGSKVTRGIIARMEGEPGNEATPLYPGGIRQGSRATYLLSQLAKFHTFYRL